MAEADTSAGGADFVASQILAAASRAKADAFVDKQNELADLQIEDLKRENAIRHWSLRVRHISDVLKLGFELALAFIVIAVAVGLATAIWQAAHADGLIIDAINVPQAMAERGLSGPVVANKLLDKLTQMQNETQSTRAASTYANDWTNDIKVQIPDTGVSLGQVVRFLNDKLGHQMHLSGDLYETTGGIALTTRIDGDPGQTFTGKAGDLDTVVAHTAESIYARAQPYRYTVYLSEQGRFSEARDAGLHLAQTGSPIDRAWAYSGLAFLYEARGDFAHADKYTAEGRRIEPNLWNLDYTEMDQAQGHDEKELAGLRREIALLGAGGASGTDAATLRLYRQLSIANESLLAGDYKTALANNVVAPDVGPTAVASNGVSLAARMHDPALARYYLQQLDEMSLTPVDVAYREGCIGDIAFFRQDWRGAVAAYEKTAAEFTALDVKTRGWYAAKPQITTNIAPFEAYAEAKLGDFAKADAVLAVTPHDCDICVLARGRVAALRHDWSGAAHWFEMVAARSPDIPFADTDWGEMLLHEGDLDSAIAKFAAANQKGPHFADPLEMWGEALIRENRSDLALAKFAEAAKYAPNWGRLHLKWGEALLWTGDRADAQKQFVIAAHLYLTPAEKLERARMKAHG
jgi:tetratricopeptide (TPR) repeat protein